MVENFIVNPNCHQQSQFLNQYTTTKILIIAIKAQSLLQENYLQEVVVAQKVEQSLEKV